MIYDVASNQYQMYLSQSAINAGGAKPRSSGGGAAGGTTVPKAKGSDGKYQGE